MQHHDKMTMAFTKQDERIPVVREECFEPPAP